MKNVFRTVCIIVVVFFLTAFNNAKLNLAPPNTIRIHNTLFVDKELIGWHDYSKIIQWLNYEAKDHETAEVLYIDTAKNCEYYKFEHPGSFTFYASSNNIPVVGLTQKQMVLYAQTKTKHLHATKTNRKFKKAHFQLITKSDIEIMKTEPGFFIAKVKPDAEYVYGRGEAVGEKIMKPFRCIAIFTN